MGAIRSFLKRYLPSPIRDILRSVLHYTQRVMRWPIILWQVQGQRGRDVRTLLRSAMAAPYLAARDLSRWQDPILLEDADVDVSGVGSFSLRARTDDLWHVLPWRETQIADWMRRVLRPGDVFIDAGANIGIYTVLAARLVGQSGRVIAVEMMPDTADRLDHHIRCNRLGNVTIVRHALSDAEDQVVVATVQEGKYGQATISADADRYGTGRRVEVRTTTLDAITADFPFVRAMKIDVEGAEIAALSGAASLLPKLEAMVYESWGKRRAKTDPVDNLLIRSGFKLRQLDGNNWLAEKAAL